MSSAKVHDQVVALGYALVVLMLMAIAFGVNWTAYESHVANRGVAAMANAISNERGVAPQPRESF